MAVVTRTIFRFKFKFRLVHVRLLRYFWCKERGVEGIHARVTQTLSGGRPLSASGLAVELKWPAIASLLYTSPQAGWCQIGGSRAVICDKTNIGSSLCSKAVQAIGFMMIHFR